MFFFRKYLPKRIIAGLLIPLVLIATNGLGVALVIYEAEWEDIVTHHFQQFDPCEASSKALGREFISRVLDNCKFDNARHSRDLPKPPARTQDLRAILSVSLPQATPDLSARFLTYNCPESALLQGFPADVFRPPMFE